MTHGLPPTVTDSSMKMSNLQSSKMTGSVQCERLCPGWWHSVHLYTFTGRRVPVAAMALALGTSRLLYELGSLQGQIRGQSGNGTLKLWNFDINRFITENCSG